MSHISRTPTATILYGFIETYFPKELFEVHSGESSFASSKLPNRGRTTNEGMDLLLQCAKKVPSPPKSCPQETIEGSGCIPLENFVLLLCQLINNNEHFDVAADSCIVTRLNELMVYVRPTAEGFTVLANSLRRANRTGVLPFLVTHKLSGQASAVSEGGALSAMGLDDPDPPPSEKYSTVQAKLWISVLNFISSAVDSPMARSSPHYIQFNGDRDSYLQLTCHSISCPRAYTVTMWVCLDEDGEVHTRSGSAARSGNNTPATGVGAGASKDLSSTPMNLTPGFPPRRTKASSSAAAAGTITLFKCSSPIGGIEALLIECPTSPSPQKAGVGGSGAAAGGGHSRGSSWTDSIHTPNNSDNNSNDNICTAEFGAARAANSAATAVVTPSVKHFTIALRTIVENSHRSVDGYEAVGHISLTTNTWQLLALTHTCNEDDHMASAVYFTVNGSGSGSSSEVPAVEAELPYPFTKTPSESQWFFCTGFKGRLSSVCLYSEAATTRALTMLYEATAAVPSFDAAFTVANGNSGSSHLGSIWVKGEYASVIANKYKPIFCVTAGHFMSAPPCTACGGVETVGVDSAVSANLSSLTPILPYAPTGLSHMKCSEMKPLSQSVSTVGTKVHLVGENSQAIGSLPPGAQHDPPTSSYASSTGGSLLIPSLSGSCVVHRNAQNWNTTLLSAGGCTPLLYILYNYCCSYPTAASSKDAGDVSSDRDTAANVSFYASINAAHSACIATTLNLLSHFVKSSVDAREQFLLLHGFHVIALCLHQLPQKEVSITRDIAEGCFKIVRSFGLDSTLGDGVAAALQGLLFNFHQVWGYTSVAIKELVLTNLVSLLLANNSITFSTIDASSSSGSGVGGGSSSGMKTVTSGDHLYKYIGLQRILDVLKLYLLPITSAGSTTSACNSATASPAQPAIKTPPPSTPVSLSAAAPLLSVDVTGVESSVEDSEGSLSRATDMCVCLLSMTLEAAFKANPSNVHVLHRPNTSPYYEVELLLIALEGSDDGALMERLLRLLYNLRLTSPTLLKQVLYDSRYPETTALVILTRNDISFCSRRLCLLLVIWALGEDLMMAAAQVNKVRRSMPTETAPAGGALAPPLSALSTSDELMFQDEMYRPHASSPGPSTANPSGANGVVAGNLNTQQKILRANRRLSTSIKGGIKVLRRQSVATAQRIKGGRDRAMGSHSGSGGGRDADDENVVDRGKWEQLSANIRRIDKSWRIVSSIRDVIAQKLPPNEVTELLGFLNNNLLAATAGDRIDGPAISMSRRFYSLNLESSSSSSSSSLSPVREGASRSPRSPRKNQGDKWVLDEKEATLSYLPSIPSSPAVSPASSMVTPRKAQGGGFSLLNSVSGANGSSSSSNNSVGRLSGVVSKPTLTRTVTMGYNQSTELEVRRPMDEMLDIFAHDGPLICHNSGSGGSSGGPGDGDDELDGQGRGTHSQLHVWLVLPLLPLFLSYTSLHNIQRTLMSLSVTMKTDASEALILSMLTDSKSWVTCFVQLAMLGADKKRQVIKTGFGIKGGVTSSLLPASPPVGGYSKLSGISTGHDANTELEIAETCIELALDCLALVLEKKMTYVNSSFYQSYHSISSVSSSESDYELVDTAPQMSYSSVLSGPVGNSWSVWKTAMKTMTKLAGGIPADIHVSPLATVAPAVDGGIKKYPTGTTISGVHKFMLVDAEETLDQRFSKRTIALVFQRLARTSEPWADGAQIYNCISELMLFVEKNALCYRSCLTKEGEKRAVSMAIDGSASYEADTDSGVGTVSAGDELPPRVVMNTDERHLLCFLIDLCANMRKQAHKGVLGGREWNCVLIGMRVVVSCLGFCTDDLADRCAHELYLLLIYLCQPWGAGSSEVLKTYLLVVFDELHKLMVGNSAWSSGASIDQHEANPSAADDLISPHLYGRYSALMFSFMHHFSDLRDSSHAGVVISPHVEPILDALLGVDTCNQVELLFQLVQVSLRASDIVASPSTSMSHHRHQRHVPVGSHSRTQSRALGAVGDTLDSADDGLLIDLEAFSDQSSTTSDSDEDHVAVAGEMDLLAAMEGAEESLVEGVARAEVSAVNFKPGTMERDIISNAFDDYYNPTVTQQPVEPDLLGLIEFTAPSPPVTVAPAGATGTPVRPLPTPPVPHAKTPTPVTPVASTTTNRPVSLSRANSALRKQNKERELELQCSIERERALQHWLDSSYSVLLERKDAELVRLSRTVQFHESGAVATQRLWSKLSSRYEGEFMVAISVLDRHCGDAEAVTPTAQSANNSSTDSNSKKRTASAAGWHLMANVDKCPSSSYEWKLGIAHESNYPGRERKVLCRQQLDQRAIDEARRADQERAEERQRNEDENRVAMEAFQRKTEEEAAAAATAAQNSSEDGDGDADGDAATLAILPLPRSLTALEDVFAQTPVVGLDSSAITPASVPGWGIIDIDGSGEDVTISESDSANAVDTASDVTSGTASTDTAPLTSTASAASEHVNSSSSATERNDVFGSASLMEDVSFAQQTEAARLIEESERQHGRVLDTGPADEGVRSFNSTASRMRAAHLAEADIILVTAGGSYRGRIAFNQNEVWVVSTAQSIESIDLMEKRNKQQKRQQQNKEGGGEAGTHVEADPAADMEHAAAAGNTDDGLYSSIQCATTAGKVERRRWPVSRIAFIFLRRYRLRDSALEVLFQQGSPHKSFFVDFGHTKQNMRTRNEFTKALMAVAPPSAYKQSFVPAAVFRMTGSSDLNVTQKWVDGEMSNYDYLMTLNTLSGRSYNDLCQYPVMPWIISQYTESHINLHHRRNYRDLSKPMGAQNEARLNDYIERYESFADNNVLQEVPPFMYGSHYSTMVGVVLHYLVRLQPFASLHKEMQTGHFDVPDRLFSSIPRCYHHNTTMLSEVKELTPEWFAMPEFLKNVNKYKFGTSQEGEVVDDVILPPWSATPEEFVSINRQALESDYVSANLHLWIDLIFGFKQTGQAAIDANNVFYYLTYYGAVNRDAISEPMRRAIELQIAHFGSHPMQLFKKSHPAKKLRIQRPAPRGFKHCFPIQHIFYGPHHQRSSVHGGGNVVNVSIDPAAAVLVASSAAVDNPKDHGRPSLGVAAYPCSTVIPTTTNVTTQGNIITSSAVPNNNVFSSVCKVGTASVDNVSFNTTAGAYLRWGVQNIDSLEEFLSVDSSATLVSRRRTVCRIVYVTVLADQIVCLLDNGIIEVYRYGMSPGAKASIAHIQTAMQQQQQQANLAMKGGRHGHARGRGGAQHGRIGGAGKSANFSVLGADPLDPYSADSSEAAAVCNLLYRRSHFVHAYGRSAAGSSHSATASPQKQRTASLAHINVNTNAYADSAGGGALSISDMERQYYAKEGGAGGTTGGNNNNNSNSNSNSKFINATDTTAGGSASNSVSVSGGAAAGNNANVDVRAAETAEHNLMDLISFDDGFITTAVPQTATAIAASGRDKDTGRLLSLDRSRPKPLALGDAVDANDNTTGWFRGSDGAMVPGSGGSASLLEMDSDHGATGDNGSNLQQTLGSRTGELDEMDFLEEDSSSEEEEEVEEPKEQEGYGHQQEAEVVGSQQSHQTQPQSQPQVVVQVYSQDAISVQEAEEEREKREAIAAVQALLDREQGQTKGQGQTAGSVSNSRSVTAVAVTGTATPSRVGKAAGAGADRGTPGGGGSGGYGNTREKSIPPMVCNGDIVVAVERDSTHFEQPPRIPLAYIISNTSSYSNYLPHTNDPSIALSSSYINQMRVYRTLLDNYVSLAHSVYVDAKNNKQWYSFGYCDGRINIRTFDQRLGTVTLGGEYRVHKFPVVCVASDVVNYCYEGVCPASTELSSTNADMLLGAAGVSAAVPPNLSVVHASVDTVGVMTIWTMVRKCTAAPAGQANTNPNSTAKWLVAKRPSSVFKLMTSVNRHAAAIDMNAHCCDISSDMNIAVGSSYLVGSVSDSPSCCSGSASDTVIISVFSLERQELIHLFVINVPAPTGENEVYTYVDKLCLSSEGVIVVHFVTVDTVTKARSSTISSYSLLGQLLGSTSTTHTQCTPVYRAKFAVDAPTTTTGGASTDATCITQLASQVTFMSLPAHSSFLLTGHENGAVCVWSVLNMTLLYTCSPHETYQRYSAAERGNSYSPSGAGSGNPQPKVSPSPILHIALGPNPTAPIIMAITTLSGQLYVRPLPDFLTVERSKGILSLAQLVSAPLTQLTKTTSQVANWTSDTASVAAQSAKQLADDAFVEMRKTASAFGKSNIVKNVGSFFGSWGGGGSGGSSST